MNVYYNAKRNWLGVANKRSLIYFTSTMFRSIETEYMSDDWELITTF